MSFDYIVARLSCPECGAVTEADTATDLQTHLQASPQGEYLAVGDEIDLRDDGPAGAGYVPIRDPGPDEPLRVVESWGCPVCDEPYNWAEVTIEGGYIRSVETVELSAEMLDRVHYLTWDINDLYRAVTGDSLYEEGSLRPDYLPRLRTVLSNE